MSLNKGQNLINGTIDQYLVGIADGLRKAQEELSQIHVSRPGESPITYHIPSLEFELKMAFEMEEQETSNPSVARLASVASIPQPQRVEMLQPKIRAIPLNPGNTSSSESFEASAASTIKGRFVSVPANGGSPLPVLNLRLRDTGKKTEVEVVAQVLNTLGEALEGTEVEFNVDRDYSAYLNSEAIAEGQLEEGQEELPPGTRILQAVVDAEENGEATATLKVTSKPGQQIAIAVFAAGTSESLIFETPDNSE
ncbi:MAG: hypothetical protein JJU20_13125 [Opitutales bacterium]|nr:hypothetical protein [Opitutales bacterium]